MLQREGPATYLSLIGLAALLGASIPSLEAQTRAAPELVVTLPSGHTVELLDVRLVSLGTGPVEGQVDYLTHVPADDSIAEFFEAWQVAAITGAQLDSTGRGNVSVIFVRTARRDGIDATVISRRERAFFRDEAGHWRPYCADDPRCSTA